jgi:hypothetical protein
MRRTLGALLPALLFSAGAATAQDAAGMQITTSIENARTEAAAGVLFGDIRRDRDQRNEFPDIGLALSVALNIGQNVALVGEAALIGEYWTPPTTRMGQTDRVYTLLAGPRVATSFHHVTSVRDATHFRIFGQVLAGGRASDIGLSGRAIQPGAGVDFYARQGLTFRNSIDYCFVSGAGGGISGGRWLISVVFGPG